MCIRDRVKFYGICPFLGVSKKLDSAVGMSGAVTVSYTHLYNTPEKYLREFLDSFVNQTAPNGQLCLCLLYTSCPALAP